MFISGVQCDECGTILYFHGMVGKGMVEKLAKKEGWQVIRKSGMTPEQAYCPGHVKRRKKT